MHVARQSFAWILWVLTDTAEPKDPTLKACLFAAAAGLLVGGII